MRKQSPTKEAVIERAREIIGETPAMFRGAGSGDTLRLQLTEEFGVGPVSGIGRRELGGIIASVHRHLGNGKSEAPPKVAKRRGRPPGRTKAIAAVPPSVAVIEEVTQLAAETGGREELLLAIDRVLWLEERGYIKPDVAQTAIRQIIESRNRSVEIPISIVRGPNGQQPVQEAESDA
jgi:hypothetical protein